MEFETLSDNSQKLLSDLVRVDNPTMFLDDLYSNCYGKEKEELNRMIDELCDGSYLKVKWANLKPYLVNVTSKGRIYEEQMKKYQADAMRDSSIFIGDNNKFSNTVISNGSSSSARSDNDKKVSEKHPIITNVLISLIVGFILLFPFWQKLIAFLGEVFNGKK